MNDKKKRIQEAVALRYSPDENSAPEIIAQGKGIAAEKILQTAENSNIPVYQDENLVHALNMLHIGDEIPPELYDVVAEILIFVSNLDEKYGDLNERIGKK